MSASQVTNPAIDPLREGLVMSLEVNLGKRGNILEVGPENASQVCSSYFLLFNYFTVFHFFFSLLVVVLSHILCYSFSTEVACGALHFSYYQPGDFVKSRIK